VLCAGIVLAFAFFSAAEGGIPAALPCVPFAILCGVQFFRPTIVGWIALVLTFAAYTIEVAVHWRSLSGVDLDVFLLIGLIPETVLLWSWPHRVDSR